MGVTLTAPLVEAFLGIFLSPKLDNPAPVGPFHRESWELYCSAVELAGVAAPRGHAKSTALTYAFILASALFRFEPHTMLISSSEELAMGQLGDITKELKENEDLRAEFGISKFLVESKGEIIVRCDDGYEFRILARGVEQRVRGIKWNGRRPGLIVGDDMEEDEQVENLARRKKLARWVNRALIPMGRKGCKVRIHGTILHSDSLLARIMKPTSGWSTLFYRAHASFDDFSNILWPGYWTESMLRARRQQYISDGDPAGYSQEYLNNPLEDGDTFLRAEQFQPMEDHHWEAPKLVCVGVDFAISKADKANRTSMTVGGQTPSQEICFLDQHVGRWDSSEIIDTFFDIQALHRPTLFFVESGQIWLSIKPILTKEMFRRGVFLNIDARTPIKDKKARGRAYQKRMKAGACFFPTDAHWYESFKDENLRFTGDTEATLDDQFDSAAILVLGLETMPDVEPDDFDTPEEIEFRQADPLLALGRNAITGY